jgi:putative ABC transport system permease protein
MSAQLSLTGFAWKNPLLRRLRTLLTLCGIGMAIGAIVGLVGFSKAFDHAWLQIDTSSSTDIAVVQRTFLNTSLDESAAQKLKALPEVEQVAPMIYTVMDLRPEVNAPVYGWKAGSYEFQSLQLLSGEPFQDGRPQVMLGDLLTGEPVQHAGRYDRVQWILFTITAIYHLTPGVVRTWRSARLSPVGGAAA